MICTYIDPETKKEYYQRGTGFIVGKNIILTALHVLFFKEIVIAERYCPTTKQIIKDQKHPNEFAYKI